MATVVNRYPRRGPSILDIAWAGLQEQNRKEAKAAKKKPADEAEKQEAPHAKGRGLRSKSKHSTGQQDQPKAKKKAKAKPADKSMLALPKEATSQHGTYMAIVRRLACRRCGAPPPSEKKGNEFCHRDEGKGMGIKTDVREGWAGCPPCHKAVGEGKMPRPEKRRLNDEYAASTRAEVEAKGLWPKTLPKWEVAAP